MYTFMYNMSIELDILVHVHKMSSLQKNNEAHVSHVITIYHEYTYTRAKSSHTMYCDTHKQLYRLMGLS